MARIRHFRPAAAAFVLMASMALTTTALSFFVEPVCSELGLSRGAFTVSYSLMTAAGTFASPLLGQIIQRRGVRPVAAVSALWAAAGLFAFSLCGSLPAFYLTAALTGLFGTACVILCAGILVQTHYRGSTASRLTGLVMSGSGVGGMAVSLFLPNLIEALGWRSGYRLVALGWLVLVLSAVLLLRGTPCFSAQRTSADDGMTRDQALHTPQFWLLAAVILLLSGATGIQQHLPAVLSGSARVSGLMSAFTAALALGKLAQGFLYGKIGPVRGGLIVTALYAAGFALLRMGLLLPGLLLLALGMGTVTTLMPLLTRLAFGGREYAAIWSILSAVSNLAALVTTPLFGAVYDRTGGYSQAVTAAFVGIVLSLGLTALAFCSQSKGKKALDRRETM